MIEHYRKWFIHIAASLAFGLILLDETVVAVALPTIQKEFSMTLVLSHWVMNSYLLVLAGFIAIGGKLGDIFGFRNVHGTGWFFNCFKHTKQTGSVGSKRYSEHFHWS